MNIALIAVGFSRPKSMERLLDSLFTAAYNRSSIDLIISIDKGKLQDEVIKVAEDFRWEHGKKIIRSYQDKIGLRNHIFECGGLTNDYDAIVVLEDDIVVSKYFFSYIQGAVDFYKDDYRIAGISLYSFDVYPGNGRPFEAAKNEYDVFLMKMSQSWGQCWTKKMWQHFQEWYQAGNYNNIDQVKLPSYVAKWNEQSWMKIFDYYLEATNRFFVYPYFSLSTNNSDIGEHSMTRNNDFQVSLVEGEMHYRFSAYETLIKYDMHFQRLDIAEKVFPNYEGKKMLDLYGDRKNFTGADFLISIQSLPYKVVKTFQLIKRPLELNCLNPIDGDGAFLYDLAIRSHRPKLKKYLWIRHDIRAIHWKQTLFHGLRGMIFAIKGRLRKKRMK